MAQARRKCQNKDCSATARYNYKDIRPAMYCSKHKEKDMIDSYQKLCKAPNCLKVPSFNYENETTTLYCITHKKDGMVSINKNTCMAKNCNKTPNFNIAGEKKGIYCSNHKKPDMIDVVHARCLEPNCKKMPCYNKPGIRGAIYCAKHKKDDMVNVLSPMCIEPGCEKKSAYNFEGQKARLYCAKHRKQGMVQINGAICHHEGCKTTANYNYEGQKRGKYCVNHKELNMVDVKNKRCKTPLCGVGALKHYDDYCHRCFLYLFPDRPVARNYKTKERSVVDFIKAEFPDRHLVFDKTVQDGCSQRRPDILLDMGDQVLIVEIDENQHQVYDCSCENKRIMEISQDLHHRPLVFIRFNPDDYLDESGKKVQSCWKAADGVCSVKLNKKAEWEQRLNSLKESLNYWISNKTEKTVEIVQLYYDMNA